MTRNDDLHVSAPNIGSKLAQWSSQHGRRARLCAVAMICVLAAGALAGCGMNESVGSLNVDPGRYDAYHCKDFAARLTVLQKREKDLGDLMDKARESAGGELIGALTYRTQYETAVSEEKLLRRTAAEKQCDIGPIGPPAFQSDQTIR